MSLHTVSSVSTNMEYLHKRNVACDSQDGNTNESKPKAMKDTALKELFAATNQVSVLSLIPTKMNAEMWKQSGFKSRILYLCIPLLYLIPAFDIIRFLCFLVIKQSTDPTFIARCSVIFVKLFPNLISINLIWNRHKVNEFIHQLSNHILQNETLKNVDRYNKLLMFNLRFEIGVSIIFSLVIYIALPLCLPKHLYILDVMAYPLLPDSYFYKFILILNCITNIWTYFLHAPSNAIIYIAILIITDEFKYISEKFRNLLNEYQDNYTRIFRGEELSTLISYHVKLCCLLKSLNAVLQYTCALAVAISIIICCTIANQIANNLSDVILYVLQFSFAVFVWVYSITLIYKGIQINSYAHQLVEHIYAMPLHDLSHEAIVKLAFFLNRLTSEQIGISIGGCFVINPASVLTLIGSIITYSIVAYQTSS